MSVDEDTVDEDTVDAGKTVDPVQPVQEEKKGQMDDVTAELSPLGAGAERLGGIPDGELREHAAAEAQADAAIVEDPEARQRRLAETASILEALIFASPDPLTPKALGKLLETEPKEEIAAALAVLKQQYERAGGLQLVEVAGGFQIVTRPELNDWVRRLFQERSSQKLSVQALETLAVIAYRQPITAIEITEVRGVNTSGVLNTLLERHLVKIVGRKQVVGRPFLYATTKEFLIRFGLNDLSDLPKVEDMAEAFGVDAPLLVEGSPSEDLLPLQEPDGPVDDAIGSGEN